MVEARNRLENYEYISILVETRVESGFIVVSCQLQTLCQNSQQSQGRRQCFWTLKPVNAIGRRNISASIHSRDRHMHFLGKKFAGKPN